MLSPEQIDANAADLPGAGVQGPRPRPHRGAAQQRVARDAERGALRARPALHRGAAARARRLHQPDGAAEPISALELLYPVLQGYDSVAIDADVELGGTDQKFNLLFGATSRSRSASRPQSVMTMPILPGTDGVRRMSKSLGNYVGVTDPPEEMFGKLMSIPDDVMGQYYLLLLGESSTPSRPPNEAKRELARRLGRALPRRPAAGRRPRRASTRSTCAARSPTTCPTATLEPDADGSVHLPALIAAAFGISSSRGAAPDRAGGVKLDGEAVPAERLDLPAGRARRAGSCRSASAASGAWRAAERGPCLSPAPATLPCPVAAHSRAAPLSSGAILGGRPRGGSSVPGVPRRARSGL